MHSVSFERPFKRTYVRPKDPPLWGEKKPEPRRYVGWLCTMSVKNATDDHHGWPKKSDHENTMCRFGDFYPELIAWLNNEPHVDLKWHESVSVIERPVTVITVSGTLAGMRRFEAAWGDFVNRFMPIFAHSERLLCYSYHWPDHARFDAHNFFPYELRSSKGLLHAVHRRLNAGEMIGPFWEIDGDNSYRFRDARDAMFISLTLEEAA